MSVEKVPSETQSYPPKGLVGLVVSIILTPVVMTIILVTALMAVGGFVWLPNYIVKSNYNARDMLVRQGAVVVGMAQHGGSYRIGRDIHLRTLKTNDDYTVLIDTEHHPEYKKWEALQLDDKISFTKHEFVGIGMSSVYSGMISIQRVQRPVPPRQYEDVSAGGTPPH